MEEFVRDAVQAVHCLCTADADPVQIGDLGGHGVGDHVGVTVWGVAGEGVSVFVMAVPGCGGANPRGGWWCVGRLVVRGQGERLGYGARC